MECKFIAIKHIELADALMFLTTSCDTEHDISHWSSVLICPRILNTWVRVAKSTIRFYCYQSVHLLWTSKVDHLKSSSLQYNLLLELSKWLCALIQQYCLIGWLYMSFTSWNTAGLWLLIALRSTWFILAILLYGRVIAFSPQINCCHPIAF